MMKVICISLLYLLISCTNQSEDYEFLPGISYENKNGEHNYKIEGLFEPRYELKKEELIDSYLDKFPDTIRTEINLDKSYFLFVTKRKLKVEELKKSIDKAAFYGGILPYFIELRIRSEKISKQYNKNLFSLKKIKKTWQKTKKWTRLHMFHYESCYLTNKDDGDVLIISASTAHCMAHSRYSFRIIDNKREIIWSDENKFGGHINYYKDENTIYIKVDDHGEISYYIVERNDQKK